MTDSQLQIVLGVAALYVTLITTFAAGVPAAEVSGASFFAYLGRPLKYLRWLTIGLTVTIVLEVVRVIAIERQLWIRLGPDGNPVMEVNLTVGASVAIAAVLVALLVVFVPVLYELEQVVTRYSQWNDHNRRGQSDPWSTA